MSPILIAITGVIYLWVAADLAWHGKAGMANTQDQRRLSRPLHPLVRWRRNEVEQWA